MTLPDGVLVLRSPTLADGPAWSAARVANREWLERAFPAWGTDWEAEQSEVAWAQRWWRLRRLALDGRAKPFVITLDGELIGEIGIDAVDPLSGGGEASVWMVRSHGSATVMTAASLLLIDNAFNDRHPVDRLVSPVATSSRAGRSPGLSAVGFEIEATVPRRVGAKGLVDHDIWVLHHTAANRRSVKNALRALSSEAPDDAEPLPPDGGSSGSAHPRRALALTAGRAALREARTGARRASAAVAGRRSDTTRPRTVPLPGADRSVSLRPATRRDVTAVGGTRTIAPDTTRWAVEEAAGLAVVGHRTDAGTATTEVFAAARPGTARDLLAAALSAVLDDVRPGVDEQRLLVVRVPAGAADGSVPDADLLTDLGLSRIATYRGDPESPHGWSGENVWRAPAAKPTRRADE